MVVKKASKSKSKAKTSANRRRRPKCEEVVAVRGPIITLTEKDLRQMSRDNNILNEAKDIIYGEREETYGDPGKNIRAIAAYWTVHMQHKYGVDVVIDENDVCQMMISVKQARLLHKPSHRDSQVDTAGYQALMNRIQVETKP